MNVHQAGQELGGTAVICAAHPAERFGVETASLLAQAARARAVVVNPGGSLEEMVDELEETRRSLGIGRWIFWGMSGGGWLALLYARRHPHALSGIVVESACACFRVRLADPACLLSPSHPAWRDRLSSIGPTGWSEVEGVGSVWRTGDGLARVVSPMRISENMKRVMPELWKLDTRPWLSSLQLPALILCGSDDPIVPVEHARSLHRELCGSELQVIEGAGHVPTSTGHVEAQTLVREFVHRGEQSASRRQ